MRDSVGSRGCQWLVPFLYSTRHTTPPDEGRGARHQVPAVSRIGARGQGDARRALHKGRDTQQHRGT